MSSSKYLDVSSYSGPISLAQYRAAYAAGWRGVVVQAWGGLSAVASGPNPHCWSQLANAREAGLRTGIYVVLPPDNVIETHELIRLAKEAAGDEYDPVEFVALDVEDAQRRRLHPTQPVARLADAIGNVRDKPVVIYTSLSMWPALMGECDVFSDYPLWDARWGPTGGLDDGWVAYGGWTRCAMRQYQGTSDVGGIVTDLNVADLERLGLVSNGSPDPREELERLARQVKDLRFSAGEIATLSQSVTDALRRISEG